MFLSNPPKNQQLHLMIPEIIKVLLIVAKGCNHFMFVSIPNVNQILLLVILKIVVAKTVTLNVQEDKFQNLNKL